LHAVLRVLSPRPLGLYLNAGLFGALLVVNIVIKNSLYGVLSYSVWYLDFHGSAA